MPSLQPSTPTLPANTYRLFGGADAIYYQRSPEGNSWIRAVSAGLDFRKDFGGRAVKGEAWGSARFGRASGPFAQKQDHGEVEADLSDRRIGGEVWFGDAVAIGTGQRAGQLRVSATSPSFLPLVFLPTKPGTVSAVLPLDSKLIWVSAKIGSARLTAKREWRSEAIFGRLPYSDRPGSTDVPAAANPTMNEWSVVVPQGPNKEWTFSWGHGERRSYVEIGRDLGFADAQGSARDFSASLRFGRSKLTFACSDFSGGASGIVYSGGTLHIGLPVASVVTYNSHVRGKLAQVELDMPLRLRNLNGALTLGHLWASGEASGDYDADILFLNLRGTGSARFNNRLLLAKLHLMANQGAVRPYVTVQQVVPYTVGHHGRGGGSSGGGAMGRTYGGGSLEFGIIGNLGR